MRKFLIKVNGVPYDVEVDEVKVESVVSQPVAVATPVAPVAKVAPQTAPQPVKATEQKIETIVPAGASTIKSPMPGTILKVNVNTGDSVKKGQVLLILEAMKMENEITAPVDGKIASVNVQKGKSVSVGEVLISIA